MTRSTFALALLETGRALRRPESLALRWRDRDEAEAPPVEIFGVLLGIAILGVALYGAVMRAVDGPAAMALGAFRAPLAAGGAWTIALPSLYIIGRALGSRLDSSTTLLAACLTVGFGALAMVGSAPITAFISWVLPFEVTRWLVNIIVFAGVGVAMTDVFLRVMGALEPERSRAFAVLWLGLVGAIGTELFVLFDVFHF